MTALPSTDITRMVLARRTDDRDLIPLVSPTTVVAAGSPDGYLFSWGFAFRFDGTTYTEALIYPGRIDLTQAGISGERSWFFDTRDPIDFVGADVTAVIAAWWDDCAAADDDGYVKAEVQGTAPFRRCVIECYLELYQGQDAVDCDRVTTQIVIYETWDRIELRYGAVETRGTPDRSGYAGRPGYAAVAGVWSSMAGSHRRRSFLTDTLPFGGRDSATPAYGDLDDWPACTFVFEPAYPYVGRILPIGEDELSGLQDPYAAPIRKLANNIHHLFLKHAPPLINVAPFFEHGSAKGHTDQSIVQITRPSADSLSYDFRSVTWGETTNTAVGLSIGKNNVDAPDPDDDSDWTEIASATISPIATGIVEWDVIQAVLLPASEDGLTNRLYRWRYTCSSLIGGADKHLKVLGTMVTPRVTDLIDLDAGAGSGWEWVSIAQFVQEGASIHPETYNRIWKNAARVMRDRWQRVCSIAIPFVHGGTPKVALTLDASAAKPARTLGVVPCSVAGQAGATLRVTAYAYDTNASGGHLYVSERGGGTGADLDVAEGPGYLVTAQTLEILRDQPALAWTIQPGTELHLLDAHADWVPGE